MSSLSKLNIFCVQNLFVIVGGVVLSVRLVTMSVCVASSEVTKLQQHLALLKEEYGKLQSHCAEVERKYTLAAASAGDLSETSFVARLLMTVATLYGRETYSDITIKLQSKSMPGHKFVLNARSDDWNEEALKDLEELGEVYCCYYKLIDL